MSLVITVKPDGSAVKMLTVTRTASAARNYSPMMGFFILMIKYSIPYLPFARGKV